MSGPGTRELALVDILTQVSPQEMQMLQQGWTAKYYHQQGDLEHAVSRDTSFNFREVLCKLIRGPRMAPGMTNPGIAEAEAFELYQAGERRLGTNDSVFINICTRSSAEHLQLVSAAYAAKHKHSLKKAIKKETSGDFCRALCALCTPRVPYIAKRIHEAVARIGTNDSLLVRMFGMYDKAVLAAVDAWYSRKYSHSIEHDVRGDTSGDFKRLLVRLLR
eukprot:TRINITY_DN2246_c0_g1_i21.p1 TRINITY_DN2246_c0_g1~~TRINITY_DN2246_c0_g1_i21.p1  ORF type:complete len:219 (+),score=74.81 TRINITY_DN2246_c0_g1_i21:177-833(+)